MSDHDIVLWTFAFTVVGVTIAAIGIFYAIKTLQAGADSQLLAVEEAKKGTEIAKAQFWVMVRGVLANYDDVHAKLRNDGVWARHETGRYSTFGPVDPEEWARVELYMGMFEYCEILISRGLLDPEDFFRAYEYRLENLLQNAVIVEEKLHKLKGGWNDFWHLCERFNINIPSIEELHHQ